MTREIVAARLPSRRLFLAAPVLAAAVLAVAAPALAAGALEVSLSPGAATWRDRVVVTVSGTVVTSCGPEVVQVRPEGAIPPPGGVIGLEVFLLPCDVLAPPQAHAFAVSLELPQLPVGEYELRVEDGTAGGEVTTVELTVHDVSTVEVIPPDVARTDQPVTLRVRSYASCASIDVSPVAAGVVEIEFATPASSRRRGRR